MVTSTTPRQGLGKARRSWTTPLLALAVAAMAATRWLIYVLLGRTLNLFEDGTSTTGGMRILSGQMPYTDFFAFYGPLTYILPGLAHAATGSVTTSIFGLDLVIGVLCATTAYLVTAILSRRPVFALATPVVLLLLGANTARTLPALIALLLLARFETTKGRGWLLAAGGLAGVGLLWIQDVGAWLCVAVLVVCLMRLFIRQPSSDYGPISLLIFSAGVAAALLPWTIYCLARSALDDWLYWTLIFPNTGYTNRDATGYIATLIQTAGTAAPIRSAYLFLLWILPFIAIPAFAFGNLVLGAAAFIRSLRGRARKGFVPALSGTYLVLAIYSLLQLRILLASVDEAKLLDSCAPTIIGTVVVLTTIAPPIGRGYAPWVRVLALVLAVWLCVWSMWFQARNYLEVRMSPRPVVANSVGGLPFSAASPPPTTPAQLDALIAEIHDRTSTSDPILVLPTSPLVYAIANRMNPTRYDYLDPVYTTASVDSDIAAELRTGTIHLVVAGNNSFPGREIGGPDIAPLTYKALADQYRVTWSIGDLVLYTPR